MSLFRTTTLRRTEEFVRINALPRRTWSDGLSEQWADYFTAQLRTPRGQMRLRPIQAIALKEAAEVGGLFGAIRVGGGKTLLSALLPVVMRSVRPCLLLPASLVDKTRDELGRLMMHWNIGLNLMIQSYEMLGRVGADRYLENNGFDLIITDEAHRLKNPKAGVTRRVARYMHDRPRTMFAALSGTIIKESIEDFAHLISWALKDGTPLPLEAGELTEWSECLGKQVNPLHTYLPGPLLEWAAPEDVDPNSPTVTARQAFRRRLIETPGVVTSGDEQVACSLYIRPLEYKPGPVTEANFDTLRSLWETPDGWTLSEAIQVWAAARQLALGFHYVWDPRPPQAWLNSRRGWARFVRAVLSYSQHLFTEHAVALATMPREVDACLVAPELDDHAPVCVACNAAMERDGPPCPTGHPHDYRNVGLRDLWERTRPSFIPNVRMAWHDDAALNACVKWNKEGPGIIWTEHSFFARELSRRTGLQYFGREGLDAHGNSIDKLSDAIRAGHTPPRSVIASARANSTGRNLQAWSRNLITSAPAGAPAWEQLLGRTHRDGQLADTVTVDVLMACAEHYNAFMDAMAGARMTLQTSGHAQKLLLADITMLSDSDVRERANESIRWMGNRQ